MISQKANIIVNIDLDLPGDKRFIVYTAMVHIIKGIDIFTTINAVIIKGLNDVMRGFTHMGSKELSSAKFPVPKNPSKAKVSCKKIPLLSFSFGNLLPLHRKMNDARVVVPHRRLSHEVMKH